MATMTHSAMLISIAHLAAGTPWWIYAIVIAGLALQVLLVLGLAPLDS